jgi:RNA polymerase sigma-70 factor, ECF subfamily
MGWWRTFSLLSVDRQARFEEIYRVYADRVHAYARRRTNASAADDVVAEVFLVVWRRLNHVPEDPLPWLLGAARRVLANRRRSEGRAAALHDRLSGSGESGGAGRRVGR